MSTPSVFACSVISESAVILEPDFSASMYSARDPSVERYIVVLPTSVFSVPSSSATVPLRPSMPRVRVLILLPSSSRTTSRPLTAISRPSLA